MKYNDIDKILAEEASEFVEVIKRGRPRELARLAKWLRKSPLNIRHLLIMVAVDQELPHIDPEGKWTLDSASTAELHEFPGSSPDAEPRRDHSWLQLWLACAASALLAVGIYSLWPSGSHEFSTGIGEQRFIELEDGSVLQLNTQSRVRMRYSADTRDLDLISGEALFKVHRDAARPFRVFAGETLIQAVGTQFNVYVRPQGTTVTVLEGRVNIAVDGRSNTPTGVATANGDHRSQDVRHASLGAGEQASIDRRGSIATKTPSKINLDDVAAWRQRRLVFRQSSLGEVAAEFNRYNRHSQLEVLGGEVASRRYSGIFDADDPQSLIELLKSESDLAVETSGDVIRIRAHAQEKTVSR